MHIMTSRFAPLADNNAVYIGIDLLTHTRVSWILSDSRNFNVVAIGPSGCGKTFSLACLAHRLRKTVGAHIFILDVKGEYRSILREVYGVEPLLIDPLVKPLNPCSSVLELRSALRNLVENSELGAFVEALRYSCSYREPLARIAREYVSNDNLLVLASCFDPEGGIETRKLRHLPIAILDLSNLLKLCPNCVPTMYAYIVRSLLTRSDDELSILVVDEAWNLTRSSSPREVVEYLRLARGYGVGIFLATQSFEDLYDPSTVVENCSVALLFVGDSSIAWKARSYLNVPKVLVEEASKLFGVGECLAKIAGYSGYRLCYVDPSPER